MPYGFLDIAMTPSVKAAQAANGAADQWSDFHGHRAFDRFGENEAAFIAPATVSTWRRFRRPAGPMSSTAADRRAS